MKRGSVFLAAFSAALLLMACPTEAGTDGYDDEDTEEEDGGSPTSPSVVTSVSGSVLNKINNSLYIISGDDATVGTGTNGNVYREIPLSATVSGDTTGIDVGTTARLFCYATTNTGSPAAQRYYVYALYEVENVSGMDLKSVQSTSNMTKNASTANVRGFEDAGVRGGQRVGTNGWVSSGDLKPGSTGYMLLGPSDMSQTEVDAIASLSATIVTMQNTAIPASNFTYGDLDGEIAPTGYTYKTYSDGSRRFTVNLSNTGPSDFAFDNNWNTALFLKDGEIAWISPLNREDEGLVPSGGSGTLTVVPYSTHNFAFDSVILFYRYGYAD